MIKAGNREAAVPLGAGLEWSGVGPLAGNAFQRRRVASRTKPMQECHPER